MKKTHSLIALLSYSLMLLFVHAETNALIEVKLFKDWVIKNECGFGNLSIKNTGTSPIRLARDAFIFGSFQLYARSLPDKRAKYRESEIASEFKVLLSMEDVEFFNLLPEETHVYEGRKFLLPVLTPFSETMPFIVSIYLGNGFWLDSEPLTVKGVFPDSVEDLATVPNNEQIREEVPGAYSKKLTLVTCQNERWLYSSGYYPVCPLSLTSKIRVEPHDNKALFKVWDGDKPMIYDFKKSVIVEGPDENNVLGKWTRERKQKAEADNAEVWRKKAEEANNQ